MSKNRHLHHRNNNNYFSLYFDPLLTVTNTREFSIVTFMYAFHKSAMSYKSPKCSTWDWYILYKFDMSYMSLKCSTRARNILHESNMFYTNPRCSTESKMFYMSPKYSTVLNVLHKSKMFLSSTKFSTWVKYKMLYNASKTFCIILGRIICVHLKTMLN